MLDITNESRSGWCIVGLKGRADAQVADTLDQALQNAVSANERVAVDLSALDYISSAGLRCLLQAARAAQAKGAEMVVCAPSNAVNKVFEISGMRRLIRIEEKLPC